jgi:hypothetical protein
LVVRRAHNEHLVLHFDGLEAFGSRLSRVFRQSQAEVQLLRISLLRTSVNKSQ